MTADDLNHEMVKVYGEIKVSIAFGTNSMKEIRKLEKLVQVAEKKAETDGSYYFRAGLYRSKPEEFKGQYQ